MIKFRPKYSNTYQQNGFPKMTYKHLERDGTYFRQMDKLDVCVVDGFWLYTYLYWLYYQYYQM